MKSKILVSAIMASAIATGASADVKLFGHLGALYDQGFGDYKSDNGNALGYAGLTGHLGVDIGSSEFGFGVGAWGGTQLWGAKYFGKGYGKHSYVYGEDYIDLSDLYFRYNGMFDFYAGRFDGHFLRADWIDNYIQGVGVNFNITSYINAWLTWANDYTTFGVMPGRIASELQAYYRFPSSFDNFGVGDRDVFAGGLNIDLGIVQIDPFFHFWLNNGYYGYGDNNIIQAGTKVALILGSDAGVKSITSGRFMWQNAHDNTFLVWLDEEVRFKNTFKIGGGWYMVGEKAGIVRMTDHARFYGRYTTPQYAGGGYFGGNTNSWYVFGGIEHNRVKFDILYAGGDYKEFSAVGSVRVFDHKFGFMREGLGIDVGAGYVNNSFGATPQAHNVIAFAKLVF